MIGTSVNNCKNKFKEDRDGDVVLKKVGRPNVLDDHLIRKVKNIAIWTRQAGGVINTKQIFNIAEGVIRTNIPDILKEFSGTGIDWREVFKPNWIGSNARELHIRLNLSLNFSRRKNVLSREPYPLHFRVTMFRNPLFWILPKASKHF